MMSNIPFIFFFFAFLIMACQTPDSFEFSHHVPDKEQRDSILTDIVIYIYKVPRGVRKENKFNPEYRHLYENESGKFNMIKYHIDNEGIHSFFLIRPVRSHLAEHRRGVFGRFSLDDQMKIRNFEELANTPRLTEEEIIEKGNYLWQDLMYFKNLDRYFLNKDYIEFPDDRVRYDSQNKEWTYNHLDVLNRDVLPNDEEN
ncbi:MAG TPA: hypothetical protein PKC30_06755 [Saprospiraceae bacterium]|nr:hypothetical protein [Saprospiraceae bacterium]